MKRIALCAVLACAITVAAAAANTDAAGSNSQLVFSTFLGLGEFSPAADFSDSLERPYFNFALTPSGAAFVTAAYAGLLPVSSGAFLTSGSGAFASEVDVQSAASVQLVESTYLPFRAFPTAVATDAATGFIYVTGVYASVPGSTFPTTPGAFQAGVAALKSNRYFAFTPFVLVLNPGASGSEQVVYSTLLGGSFDDAPAGIAADSKGLIFVAGTTSSPDFPITAGAFQSSLKQGAFGNTNAFISVLDPSPMGPSQLVYSTYFGGSGCGLTRGEKVNAMALGPGDRVYLAGFTNSSDFPVTVGAPEARIMPGACQPEQPGIAFTGPAFVTVLAPLAQARSQLLYSTYLAATAAPAPVVDAPDRLYSQTWGTAIAVDPAGRAYVTGTTNSPRLPTTKTAFENSLPGEEAYSPFVTVLDPAKKGSASLVYSTYLGGTQAGLPGPGFDSGNAIAVDAKGLVYVTGRTAAVDFPLTKNASQTSLLNDNTLDTPFNAFIAVLRTPVSTAPAPPAIFSPPSSLAYSSYFGGARSVGLGIGVDGRGLVYVSGTATNDAAMGLPVTAGAVQDTLPSGSNGIGNFLSVLKLPPVG